MSVCRKLMLAGMIVPMRITALASILIAAATASAADPRWLGFRNDTNTVVIVQGISIVNRVPRQGPRHILKPGQESWDMMIAPGNKLILVADAKQPTRVLLQQTVSYTGTNLF